MRLPLQFRHLAGAATDQRQDRRAVVGHGGESIHQQIQAAIQSGEIKSWPTIKKLARLSSDYQEVSDVKVCLVNGVPYYNVNLVSSNGAAKKIVLNAVDGSG